MHAGNILKVTVKKYDNVSLVFSTERLACLLFLMLAMINLPTWAATLSSPVVVSDQVTVTYSGYTLNRTTNTYDTQVTLSNKSSSTIEIPIQLAISNISQATVTLANASGVMADGTPYVNIPLSDNTLSPGETVKGILLKFNNPKRVSFTFSHSVLGVLPMANHPPIANAGSDSSAPVGNQITLSGMASSDEDGDNLTYSWRIVDKPDTSSAQLTSTNALQTQLTIDRKGNYNIELTVNDGQADSQPDLVAITTENSKPVAAAGEDQTVFVQQTANLDGINSKDIDEDIIIFKWQLVAKPAGSQSVLQNDTTQTPSLTPDKPGDYTVELIVNDGILDSDPDRVIISTQNSKPIADAGPNLQGIVGQPVILDGQLSKDADDDPLSFVWSLLNKPINSNPELQNDDQPQATLIPDLPGDYISQLIVNDGHVNSDPDTALVTVSVAPTVNNPPQITSSPVLSATVDQNYNYNVDATDSDNDTLSYSLSTFPTGMAINSQSGLISWIPTSSQTGTQSVTVNVIDGNNGNDSQSFIITVTDTSILNQTSVPDITGLARSAAQIAIQQAKLNLGTETFQHSDSVPDGKVISQNPIANNQVDIGTAVNTVTSLGPDNNLPPNPATIAPRLDPTVATNTYAASEFLYKGSNSIQTLSNGEPLAQGTIEPRRAAVIRGKVLDKQSIPLPGVTVSVLNHPELGQTLSRTDGQYDLVVNGGGALTVNLVKSGYLPSQRTQQNVPWQDYKIVEDVIMLEQDSKVTTIDLTANTIQVAEGSPVTDKDGTRQATLIIPLGTTARVFNIDGTTREVSNLNLRLTEYTVGDNGPKAMPGLLPPTSGYTYALELKAEEATVKQNGQEVLFNQPLPFYVDNFLNFPVGETAPLGYYDDQKAAWVPADSGRVVKIISINNGLADIDSDGDGVADSALGLTNAEREKLGTLYAVGKTLWRVSLTHLSSWDINWGFAPPPDAIAPNPNGRPRGSQPDLSDPNCSSGSIIECENQTLGETLPVVATPYTLNYRSSWQQGRRHVRLDIPLSGETVPASLKRIDLVIHLEGRTFTSSLPPAAQQAYHFDWDGLDAYGRPVQGVTSANVEIGFVYRGVYATTSKFGYNGYGLITGSKNTRDNLIIWQKDLVQLKSPGWVPHTDGLGGWTLDIHHVYDPWENTLYLGSGNQRGQEASRSIVTTVAGNGEPGFGGDGGPATSARLSPRDIAVGPDGSFYIADYNFNNYRVRRVGSNGIITTVAGNGQPGFSGDGGPATEARLQPNGVALGLDDSLYIADGSNNRIRRVGPDGIINTVVGNGQSAFSGDGGPAIAAGLRPCDLVLGADGSLYIADCANNRIRRVGPDGIINTVAGNGQFAFSGDGGPATSAGLGPCYLALGSDGSLYIADCANNRIRRMGPDGIITTVAGNGQFAFSGDGGPATSAGIVPSGVEVGPDGSLYIASEKFGRIRRVGPEGIITTIVGNGNFSQYAYEGVGDGGPATSAAIRPDKVALGPDGNLFIAHQFHRILKMATSLPGFSVGDMSISSEDGAELYQFTAEGRHLRTLNALTGATLFAFSYDGTGRLSSVIDGNSNVTTIERDAIGNPTAVVAPLGQRTTLTLDTNGYLAKAINPGGEAYQMAYNAAGLLTAFTDPNGNSSTMSYDANGRLTKDSNAAGGSQSLARINSANGYEVSVTTVLGRSTTHGVTKLSTGNEQRTSRSPDGTQSTTINATNGTHMTTAADGTVTTLVESPDPRFAMQSPIASKLTIASGGLTSTLTSTRTASLSSPANPLSLTGLIDTVTINGRKSTSTYDAAAKTVTNTSAAGRKAATPLDNLGRIVQAQVTGILDTNLSYDTRGRLAAISQGSSPDDRKATFSYNPEGYLDTVTDPLGRTASFDYDAAGRIPVRH